MKATGTNNELMKNLGISRTTLYETIAYLRDEMQAPITYNKAMKTYEYEYLPKFYIGFEMEPTYLGDRGSDRNSHASHNAGSDDDNWTSDDELEAMEMETMFGGNDDWNKSPDNDDSDNEPLDDDINFNDLYFDD
jgi:hypothetical protein